MKHIKVSKDILGKLPNHAQVNGEWCTIVWQKHTDGTMSFVSLRQTPDDLERLTERG